MTGMEVVARTGQGEDVHRVVLESDALRVELLTYGATLASVRAPDRRGDPGEVLLGFDDPAGWLGQQPYLGATVGRFANRIAGGRFTLDGRAYQVPPNNGPNALHGGPDNFSHRVWSVLDAGAEHVTLRLESADGDQGFPGGLEVTVTYTVDGSMLRMAYAAGADAPTVVNLTNHAYLNLAGPGTPTVDDHVLTVDASSYLPTDPTAIPLGPPAPVEGTPFDFRTPTAVGARVRDDHEQLRLAQGYDHALVLDDRAPTPTRAAVVHDPSSGRTLELRTDQPAVQVYSGGHLDGTVVGRGGQVYGPRAGLCLETEHFPDSPNHTDYPSTVLRPGEELRTTTEWHFGTG